MAGEWASSRSDLAEKICYQLQADGQSGIRPDTQISISIVTGA